MSEVTVPHEKARERLEVAWAKVDEDTSLAVATLDQIKQVLLARDVAFKYILVTGFLAKLTNPEAHPRALQAKSDLPGAYDARSLCHKVVVPFEKDSKLNLLGLSNEPLVRKSARHPQHDKGNTQLKNKRLAAVVHDLLELARESKPEAVEAMLVAALRIGRELAKTRVVATADLDTNLRHVLNFISEFLKEGDAGARLVAVTGAFITLLSESYDVKVYQSTTSDQFAGTAGDIEVFAAKELYTAYECKHRPLNVDDLRHGVRKAKQNAVPEYCFVTAEGLVQGQEEAIRAEVETALDSLDVSILDVYVAAEYWAVALNAARRAQFGDKVASILRDSMRRHDAANRAAELWNSLE
jgi:hypothetical protein